MFAFLKDEKKAKLFRRWLLTGTLLVVFIILVFNTAFWENLLRGLFPNEKEVLYKRISLPVLVSEHLYLVFLSSTLAVTVGLFVGISVTRYAWSDFLEPVNDLSSLGQTIPPVAVLALAVPFLGFGVKPTIVALFLYSILPVIRNTIAGIQSVSPLVIEAAEGMGMSRRQILWKIEIPLAWRVIMAGVRMSVIINIGTATIGAVVGSGGLGTPIVSGLVRDNPALVLEGAALAALLALITDRVLALVQSSFFKTYAREEE